MHIQAVPSILLLLAIGARAAEPITQPAPLDPARQIRQYRDYALSREGNTERGRALFNDAQRVDCVKCHSVDGSSSKAGPDLFAVGDKFPRRELIDAVLQPSATIAIGYGTTI